jgi:hypothetical protein
VLEAEKSNGGSFELSSPEEKRGTGEKRCSGLLPNEWVKMSV